LIPIRDDAPRTRRIFVVPALIVANLTVFLLQWRLPEEEAGILVVSMGLQPREFFDNWTAVLADPGLLAGAWADFLEVGVLPLFASMFLHAGPMHLAGNMLFLWVYGDNVEDRMGSFRFLVFYLLCGVAAGLIHCFLHPESLTPVVGASGAIAGCLGAYLFLFPGSRILMVVPVFFFLTFLELPAWVVLLYWFAIQLPWVQGVLGFLNLEGVAWWAHIGGFLSGILLLPLFLWIRRPGERSRS